MRRLDPEGGSAACSPLLATAAPVSACPGLWEVSTWSGTRGASDWNRCRKPRCSRTPFQSLYTCGKWIYRQRTCRTLPAVCVIQQNCAPASLPCKATWDCPGFFLSWVLGGVGVGMKPWCSSKGKEGQEKCWCQFQLPQLSTSTWRNWVWAQAFSWKYWNLKALIVLEAPESNPWAFPLRHSFFLNSLPLACYWRSFRCVWKTLTQYTIPRVSGSSSLQSY